MSAISYSIQVDLFELSRLLTAATVSKNFRQLLLSNPRQALVDGYNGEVFHLGARTMDRLASIQALSLHEFAQELIDQELDQASVDPTEDQDFKHDKHNISSTT